MTRPTGKRPGYGARTDGLTYDEIGARLGISHARVQQIEAVALAKLRKAIKRLERPNFVPRSRPSERLASQATHVASPGRADTCAAPRVGSGGREERR